MLAQILAQGADLLQNPTTQTSLQTVGAGCLLWLLKKVAAMDNRLARIETKLEIKDLPPSQE